MPWASQALGPGLATDTRQFGDRASSARVAAARRIYVKGSRVALAYLRPGHPCRGPAGALSLRFAWPGQSARALTQLLIAAAPRRGDPGSVPPVIVQVTNLYDIDVALGNMLLAGNSSSGGGGGGGRDRLERVSVYEYVPGSGWRYLSTLRLTVPCS